MKPVSFSVARDLVSVDRGTVDPEKQTLFAPMRNERAFLPAWLAHHRAIGFEQFLIWDDASDDGTRPFLQAQPDCVLLSSKLGFGDPVRFIDETGAQRETRAGMFFRLALPQSFLPNRFVGQVDADSLLILPPGVTDIRTVIDRLVASGRASCAASVIEFFPPDTKAFDNPIPATPDGLFDAFGFFEAERLVKLHEDRAPTPLGKAKSTRLFEMYAVAEDMHLSGLRRLFASNAAKLAGQSTVTSDRLATPLRRATVAGASDAPRGAENGPAPDILLAVAHFVFTGQLDGRATRAIARQAHADQAALHRWYRALLRRVRGVPNGFIGENSVRYEGAEQLAALGLVAWPDADATP